MSNNPAYGGYYGTGNPNGYTYNPLPNIVGSCTSLNLCGLNRLNGFTNIPDAYLESGYFRNDGCYGYGSVFGPGDGYGSIHEGYYNCGCCPGSFTPFNPFYGPGAGFYRNVGRWC